jgi:hypothetical protein
MEDQSRPWRYTLTKRLSLPRIAIVAALALAMGVLYVAGQSATRVSATPSGPPTASVTTATLNVAFTVTAGYSDDQASGETSAVLTATESGAIGAIGGCSLSANSDSQTATVANGSGIDTCTIGLDADTLAEATTISLTYTCSGPGTIYFTLSQGGSTSTSALVTCGTGFNTGCNSALGIYDPCYCSGSLYNTYSSYNTSCYNPGYYNQPGFIPPTYTQPSYTAPAYTAPTTQQVTAAPVVQPAAVAALPPAFSQPIRPPSTGDAGLLVAVE